MVSAEYHFYTIVKLKNCESNHRKSDPICTYIIETQHPLNEIQHFNLCLCPVSCAPTSFSPYPFIGHQKLLCCLGQVTFSSLHEYSLQQHRNPSSQPVSRHLLPYKPWGTFLIPGHLQMELLAFFYSQCHVFKVDLAKTLYVIIFFVPVHINNVRWYVPSVCVSWLT